MLFMVVLYCAVYEVTFYSQKQISDSSTTAFIFKNYTASKNKLKARTFSVIHPFHAETD